MFWFELFNRLRNLCRATNQACVPRYQPVLYILEQEALLDMCQHHFDLHHW